ncbi:MAG: four helix bundle protein [Firmicutes bacterium]|nr:four helix bundle protein [Bacillota bacterium]
MEDSKLRTLSVDFAVNMIKMCEGIKGHHSLVNQLERSSSSIGANIHEANYAHGRADFIANHIRSEGQVHFLFREKVHARQGKFTAGSGRKVHDSSAVKFTAIKNPIEFRWGFLLLKP